MSRLERCPDFRDEIIHHWNQTKSPVYKRCPDFRVSTFRGSTVAISMGVRISEVLDQRDSGY